MLLSFPTDPWAPEQLLGLSGSSLGWISCCRTWWSWSLSGTSPCPGLASEQGHLVAAPVDSRAPCLGMLPRSLVLHHHLVATAPAVPDFKIGFFLFSSPETIPASGVYRSAGQQKAQDLAFGSQNSAHFQRETEFLQREGCPCPCPAAGSPGVGELQLQPPGAGAAEASRSPFGCQQRPDSQRQRL